MATLQTTERPAKPRPDFPLFAHRNGQWTKKIDGKAERFGSWRNDPYGQEAEERYKDFVAAKRLKIPVTGTGDILRVGQLFDRFLQSKETRVQLGELKAKTVGSLRQQLTRMRDMKLHKCNYSLEKIPVDSLTPDHFTALRLAFPKGWLCKTRDHHVMCVREAIKWGIETQLIRFAIAFGEHFRKSTRLQREIEGETKPAKLFGFDEVWNLIGNTMNPQIEAMIMLGINCGFHNIDCSRFKIWHFDEEWLRYRREKPGRVQRSAWIWPETHEALAKALKHRPKPKGGFEELLFLTKSGIEWVSDEENGKKKRDDLAGEFRKIRMEADIFRHQVGFNALRHTFRTHAENLTKENLDLPAINHIMGHKASGREGDLKISETYRHEIDDSRIRTICEAVRREFMSSKPRKRRRRAS